MKNGSIWLVDLSDAKGLFFVLRNRDGKDLTARISPVNPGFLQIIIVRLPVAYSPLQ